MVETSYSTTRPQAGGVREGLRPSPLRMLQDRIRQFMQERLVSLLDQVDDTFFDLADNAEGQYEQTLYFDAMRIIRMERKTVEQGFLQAVANGFITFAGGSHEWRPAEASSDSLQLLEHDLLEEMIAIDTMVSKVLGQAQGELSLLSRRMGHLLGRDLEDRQNPVSPEFICDCFMEAIKGLDIGLKPRLVLFKLFERYVLNDLSAFVEQANHLLKDMGVLPRLEAEQKPKPKPSPPAAKQSITKITAKQQPVPAEPAAGKDTQTTALGSDAQGDNLPPGELQEASSNISSRKPGGPRHKPARRTRYGELISSLQGLFFDGEQTSTAQADGENAQDPADELGGEALVEMLADIQASLNDKETETEFNQKGLIATLTRQLDAREKTLSSLQAMDRTIIRLMDRLFDQMGERVAAPEAVSKQLRRLELPLARIALQDPALFDKNRHPARRLVNEIARSCASMVDDQGLGKDPLYIKVTEVVAALGHLETDVRKLSELLSDFITFVEKDKRRISLMEQRVLEEETARERLNEAHTAVDNALTERLVDKKLPRLVVEFAEKAWCKVLFLTWLKQGGSSDSWRAALNLLEQLLSLVQAGFAEPDHVSSLVEQLQEKLVEVSFDSYETGRYMGAIEQYFAQDDTVEGALQPKAEIFSLVNVQGVDADIPGEKQPVVEHSGEADSDSLEQIDALRKGAWVEFRDDDGGKPARCRLVGVIQNTGKYIFGNRMGVKVSEDYRYRMAVKMREGKLIVLDNSHLFDQALEDVVSDVRHPRRGSGF